MEQRGCRSYVLGFFIGLGLIIGGGIIARLNGGWALKGGGVFLILLGIFFIYDSIDETLSGPW